MTPVYLCHPFSADPVGNAEKCKRLAHAALGMGYLPIAPQIYLPQFVDEATQRELAMTCCEELLSLCAELWVCVPWEEISAGMAREIQHARRLGIPVRYEGFTWF